MTDKPESAEALALRAEALREHFKLRSMLKDTSDLRADDDVLSRALDLLSLVAARERVNELEGRIELYELWEANERSRTESAPDDWRKAVGHWSHTGSPEVNALCPRCNVDGLDKQLGEAVATIERLEKGLGTVTKTHKGGFMREDREYNAAGCLTRTIRRVAGEEPRCEDREYDTAGRLSTVVERTGLPDGYSVEGDDKLYGPLAHRG